MQKQPKNDQNDFLAKDKWPPHNPDLNPMDFSVWSVLQDKIGKKTYANVEALKQALRKAWDDLDVKYLRETVKTVSSRLDACIRAKGDYFE